MSLFADFSVNLLHGHVPLGLAQLSAMQQFVINSNELSGNMASVLSQINTSQLQLVVISLSDNQLTGTIPPSVFAVKTLTSFAASTNCFHGTIPTEICTSVSLNTLVLDGLTSSTRCQDRLFIESIVWFDAFLLTRSFANQPPMCLLAIPGLITLHMSGKHY
jgi:hypothetical protein